MADTRPKHRLHPLPDLFADEGLPLPFQESVLNGDSGATCQLCWFIIIFVLYKCLGSNFCTSMVLIVFVFLLFTPGSDPGLGPPVKDRDLPRGSAHPTPSSSFYVLPDAPLAKKGPTAVEYDRPAHSRHDHRFAGDGTDGPDSGIHRSYSPTSFLHPAEEEESRRSHTPSHTHRLRPLPGYDPAVRRASVSSQNPLSLPPHLGRRGDVVGELSPAPAKRVSSVSRRTDDGLHDLIVGYSKNRRRREESHSSGMSTLSTMTTNSSRNISIQEDDDGYVVRSFDIEEPEQSDSAATVVGDHLLKRVVA